MLKKIEAFCAYIRLWKSLKEQETHVLTNELSNEQIILSCKDIHSNITRNKIESMEFGVGGEGRCICCPSK